MSNSSTSYLAFCWRALKEDVQRWRWYVGLTTTLTTASKVVNAVLGTSLSALIIGLGYVYREPVLRNERWAAIAVLSISVALLLWLIRSLKRFHERAVNQRVRIAETLARRATQMEEHFAARREPAERELLEAWLNGTERDIENWLGHDAVKKFYDGSDAGKLPPDTLDGQLRWMRRYTGKLNMIVKEQYIQITPKPPSKKERAMIEETREAARAFAAKQNKLKNQ